MTQPFGISKEKLDKIVADNPPSDSMGSNIYGMIAFTIRNALVPIESEKKEDYTKRPMGLIPIEDNRCTKCNGVGWTRESIASTAANTVCPYCNGSGVEPINETEPNNCNPCGNCEKCNFCNPPTQGL